MPNTIAPLHEFLSKLRQYFQETTTTRKYADEKPPLRAELYNIAQIEHYGMELAKTHKTIMGRAPNSLLGRLAENDKILHEVRDLLIEAINDQQLVTPAGEWLLDNFYLIEEHISTGKQHLPKGYSEGLPRLANGISAGLPRVYDIALEVIAHSDGRIDIHNISRFIRAYQKVTTLKLGELWAIPIMLRLALIENLRRVAARIAVDRINQKLADHWSDLMIETSEQDPKSLILVIADMARSGPPMESSFVAELTRQLMWKGPSLTLPLTWMEQRLSENGITTSSLIDIENQQQAADQVSISNTISSLRFVNTMDWRDFVEDLSVVESILRSEKSNVYHSMDFATRDHYRHIIEHIAKYSPHTEAEIAGIVIEQANNAAAEKGTTDKRAHIGYYLIDKAARTTEAIAKVKLPLNMRFTRFFKDRPLMVFAGSVSLFSILLMFALTYREYKDGAPMWLTITLSIFTLVACSQLVISLANWIATLVVKPSPLPRLDLSKEIPDGFKTLVTIPTMITGADNITALADGLEIRYLANCKKNILFALLTDFTDADKETLPADEQLLDLAGKKIQELNNKYSEGTDIFFLFHRPRKWNPHDKIWMGYERKRGKLGALNTFLRNGDRSEFSLIAGNTAALQNTKYVITLDTDTQLPRDAAWKMIATMAHPLNRPVCSDGKNIITEGYGILQPRVGVNMPGIDSSRYLKLYANDTGVDPYTRFTSDVYQDMFREGSFIGKGIYDIDSFEKVLENRFPENRILSHDLIEGCYIRSGLISDIQLYEDNPGKFSTDVNRRHRWVRGDWQIAWWALPVVPDANRKLYKNPLSGLSRWKIFDNLRRSLVPFALIVLLMAGLALGAHPIFWGIVVSAILALPSLLASALSLLRKPKDVMLTLHIVSSLTAMRDGLLQAGFTLTCLPFEAFYTTDAIIRTAWRMLFSNKKLLQWKPSGSLEQSNDNTISNAYKAMWINPSLAIAFGVYLGIYHHASFYTAAPLLLLWIAAPAITWWVSRKAVKIKKELSTDQLSFLQKISRKTWAFFEAFVNEQNNWLPPDNFQEHPNPVVAHRTSPTNIGLALLSNLSAYDFGYLSTGKLLTRTGDTLKTMGMLERHNGHFYNWYDTISLMPLPPRYISAVDSGNLAGHLLVLKQGLLELNNKKIVTKRTFEGLRDTLSVLEEYMGQTKPLVMLKSFLATVLDAPVNSLSKVYEDMNQCLTFVQQVLATFEHEENNDAVVWAHKLLDQCNDVLEDIHYLTPWHREGNIHEVMPLSLQTKIPTLQQIADCENVTAAQNAKTRIALIAEYAVQCEEFADIEFEFLYDRAKHLLAIGYNVDEVKKDSGNYDLLASEARLSTFVAIAQNKIPQQSWFSLGRSVTENEGSLLLLSWSGSMFEYLMPLLVMPTYEQTLLHQTYKSIVEKQIAYGQKRGVPWGISESGYNAVDANHNYQYKAFGVPGTGLKRGLVDDLVIAPYASVMALMVSPADACANLLELSRLGFEGQYGFYEAIDYTPSRIPRGQSNALIKSFMVHHQGMSMLSLSYLLHDQPMQKRFEAELRFQATLLLLQEKMTKVAASITHTLDITEIKTAITEQEMRHIDTPHTPIPEVQLLSNGSYNVMVTNAGGGYSKWRDIAVTRWREDAVCDNWGTFCYIKDVDLDLIWSNTHQPSNITPKSYEAIFTQGRAEFKRFDHHIETLTEIVVSPEDDIELRRVKIINRSRRQRTLEITSYCEVVLNVQAADEIHPAFSNLFVQTTLQQDRKAIMCTRRPRSANQQLPWMCHMVKLRGIEAEEISYETSRAEFIGRGNNITEPRAVITSGLMQNNEGSVLDPIAAIKYKIVLEPGGIATFDIINGISDTQDGCQALIDKYQDKSHTERVLELAWTHSQVVLRQINATEADAQLYGRLASSIIYMNPQLRADENTIISNDKGQSGLWGYSISGDLPIVLLKIRDSNSIDLVKQMVQAHAYWRMKGLLVDLVIWNEDHGGYRQNMQEQISGLISATGSNYGDKSGSIFLRPGDQISKEDRILFETVARIIISDDKGTLADQVNRKAKPRQLLPYLEIEGSVANLPPLPVQQHPKVDFYNGIGGFSEDGKEYIIHTHAGKKAPAPWANVLANPNFGTIVSESGQSYTWIENAHEQRLTPWHNDPVCDQGGEQIYIRDEESGYIWSPVPLPGKMHSAAEYLTKHGFGYSVFLHNDNGITSELWMFVDIERAIKFNVLKLKNTSGRMRKLSVTGYVEWVLGDRRTKSAMHVVTEKDESGILYARNAYDTELNNKVAFFDTDQKTERSYTCDRNEFIGRNSSLRSPDAMLRSGLSNRTGAGFDACAAIQISFELINEEEREIVFRLGIDNNKEDATKTANEFKGAEKAWDALEKVKNYWQQTLNVIQIESPDKALNILSNGWLMYQTLVCRFWARSGYYQSGGAFGFRDQLQDALALMYSKPELSRQQIMLCATRQFEQGDVQHWWHPPTGRGVRTTCSDDYLWLPFVTARYVEHTGDTAILNETLGFINGRPLNEHEESYYDMPQHSDKKTSLYQHCVLAINNGLKFGEHGLPLIGSGDWNDGMDKVGEKGKGESVWLGFFLYDVLAHFTKLAEHFNDKEYADTCSRQAEILKDNINKNAWDGEWFRRAYFDNGTPLGSSENDECSIDSISQSWSVLSGAGRPEYATKAMKALYEKLVDKDNKLIQLLDPPFDKSSLDPGYIKGYVPGVRENGGQYSHAAIWTVMAFATIGDTERTWELLNMINPINHGNTPAEINKYKVEPYVMAADVYKVPAHLGRGGWTWYTGSAGWMYQCIIQSFLGIRQNGDTLSFNPCLPAEWETCKVIYKYKDTVYNITINGNPAVVKTMIISVDGKEQQSDVITLNNDHATHEVIISWPVHAIA